MIKFVVTKDSMRPASEKKQCFYCHEKIGCFHKQDCTLVRKKVRIRMTIDYEVEVPYHYGKNDIEYDRNDGTWCSDNAMSEINKLWAEKESNDDCMCNQTEFEYLGNDTEPYLRESGKKKLH